MIYNSLSFLQKLHFQSLSLVISEASTPVCCEDLGDRVDIGSSPQVNTQVHLLSCLHDALGSPLHGVVQPGVHNVLLRSTGHAGTELIAGSDRDRTSNTAKPLLYRILNGLQ